MSQYIVIGSLQQYRAKVSATPTRKINSEALNKLLEEAQKEEAPPPTVRYTSIPVMF